MAPLRCGYHDAVKPLAGPLLAVGVLLAAGCSNASTTNSPGPTATQVREAANDALRVAEIKGKLIGVDPDSAASVGVSVRDGVATLTGTVRTDRNRAQAVAAARSVTGIREVRDELRVDPNAPTVSQRLGDAALAARITAALLMQTGSTAVNVSVANGVATLTGTVTPNVRDVAIATARNTKGVHAVVDKLKVSNP